MDETRATELLRQRAQAHFDGPVFAARSELFQELIRRRDAGEDEPGRDL